jgi:hypothetical protein
VIHGHSYVLIDKFWSDKIRMGDDYVYAGTVMLIVGLASPAEEGFVPIDDDMYFVLVNGKIHKARRWWLEDHFRRIA